MNKITTLAQICDALSDGLHKAPIFNPNGEYLFVNATNLENGHIVDKGEGKRADFSEYQKYGIEIFIVKDLFCNSYYLIRYKH